MIQITPIGEVRREGQSVWLEIFPPYRDGLTDLEQFSHVLVLCWAHELDTPEDRAHLLAYPQYRPLPPTGAFACRTPRRPNPILVTTCRILSVEREAGIVRLGNIDVREGTPVIDIKAYFPVSDRVKDARIAPWLADWPEWWPEEGLGL